MPPRASKARARPSFCSLWGLAWCSMLIAVLLFVAYQISAHGHAGGGVKMYSYKLVREYPHDGEAFTQGLLYYGNDTLYESTGLYGMSTVRVVHLQTGKTERVRKLHNRDFGEGLTLWKDRLLQVTWLTSKLYIYDRKTLKSLGTLEHPMQDGWGLTTDGKHIIGSDGTSNLYFMDPDSFAEVRKVVVNDEGRQVRYLNELEYVNGEIWANVWQTECIARVSPKDGHIVGWILLQGLRSTLVAAGHKHIDVLNGIAWDSARDRLFVTGKLWPKLFEIALEPVESSIDKRSIRAMCII